MARAGTTESYRDKGIRLADEIEDIKEAIEKKQEKINEYHSELFTNKTDEQGQPIKGQEAIKTQIETAKENIAKYHGELIENEDSLKKKIETASNEIKVYHTYLFGGGDKDEKAIKNQFGRMHKEIYEYYFQLLKDKEGGEKSVKTQIEMFIRRIKIHHNEVSKLEKTVKELLSGATVGVLANAYRASKGRYGSIKVQNDWKAPWKRIKPFCDFIVAYIPNVFHYVLFLGPLAGIVYFFYPFLDVAHIDDVPFTQIISRILITAPLATISFFGWSSIRFRHRMYEWYNHKQRVVQMYQGFKEEVGKEGGPKEEEAIKKLLDVTVKTVSQLPPSTLPNPLQKTLIDTVVDSFLGDDDSK